MTSSIAALGVDEQDWELVDLMQAQWQQWAMTRGVIEAGTPTDR